MHRKMKSFIYIICTVLYVVFLSDSTYASSYGNMTLLKSTLLSGYDASVRPLNDQTAIMGLNTSLDIYNLLDVDTVLGKLKISFTVGCEWHDDLMTWDPAQYGGITAIRLPVDVVWTPTLTLSRPADMYTFRETWMAVSYRSNGQASWRPGGINDIFCFINIKYWPFDEHSCEISFFPYYTREMRIEDVGIFETNKLHASGEWSLHSTKATMDFYGFPVAVYEFIITRRPVFYVLTMLLPMFGTCLMTTFVFLLPSSSGERSSYSMTILLALTVFLTIISDNIPNVSNPVPVLCILLLVEMALSSLTIVVVALNSIIYNRSANIPIGPWYRALVQLARLKSRRVHDNETILEALKEDIDTKGSQNHDRKITMASINPNDFDQNMSTKTQQRDLADSTGSDDGVTWEEVSCAIDVIMFTIMTAMHIPVVLVFIVEFL